MRLAGEGVMSMGRSFQAAGARTVLMSLWSVAERPSILLMEEFLQELAQSGDKLAAWTNPGLTFAEKASNIHFFLGIVHSGWRAVVFSSEPRSVRTKATQRGHSNENMG